MPNSHETISTSLDPLIAAGAVLTQRGQPESAVIQAAAVILRDGNWHLWYAPAFAGDEFACHAIRFSTADTGIAGQVTFQHDGAPVAVIAAIDPAYEPEHHQEWQRYQAWSRTPEGQHQADMIQWFKSRSA